MQISFDPANPNERTVTQAIIDMLEDHNLGVVIAEGPGAGSAPLAVPVKPRGRPRKGQGIVITDPGTPVPADVKPGEVTFVSTPAKEPEEIIIPASVSTDVPGQQKLTDALVDPVKVVVTTPRVDLPVASNATPVERPTTTAATQTTVHSSAKPKTIEDVRAAYRAMHDVIGSDKANRVLLGALSAHGAANLTGLGAEKYQEVIDGFAKHTITGDAAASAALA